MSTISLTHSYKRAPQVEQERAQVATMRDAITKLESELGEEVSMATAGHLPDGVLEDRELGSLRRAQRIKSRKVHITTPPPLMERLWQTFALPRVSLSVWFTSQLIPSLLSFRLSHVTSVRRQQYADHTKCFHTDKPLCVRTPFTQQSTHIKRNRTHLCAPTGTHTGHTLRAFGITSGGNRTVAAARCGEGRQ